MNKTVQLTQTEKIRIRDLTDEITKEFETSHTRELIFNNLAILIEGVKLGLKSQSNKKEV